MRARSSGNLKKCKVRNRFSFSFVNNNFVILDPEQPKSEPAPESTAPPPIVSNDVNMT